MNIVGGGSFTGNMTVSNFDTSDINFPNPGTIVPAGEAVRITIDQSGIGN